MFLFLNELRHEIYQIQTVDRMELPPTIYNNDYIMIYVSFC